MGCCRKVAPAPAQGAGSKGEALKFNRKQRRRNRHGCVKQYPYKPQGHYSILQEDGRHVNHRRHDATTNSLRPESRANPGDLAQEARSKEAKEQHKIQQETKRKKLVQMCKAYISLYRPRISLGAYRPLQGRIFLWKRLLQPSQSSQSRRCLLRMPSRKATVAPTRICSVFP